LSLGMVEALGSLWQQKATCARREASAAASRSIDNSGGGGDGFRFPGGGLVRHSLWRRWVVATPLALQASAEMRKGSWRQYRLAQCSRRGAGKALSRARSVQAGYGAGTERALREERVLRYR
jgi:hypothetical protein